MNIILFLHQYVNLNCTNQIKCSTVIYLQFFTLALALIITCVPKKHTKELIHNGSVHIT